MHVDPEQLDDATWATMVRDLEWIRKQEAGRTGWKKRK